MSKSVVFRKALAVRSKSSDDSLFVCLTVWLTLDCGLPAPWLRNTRACKEFNFFQMYFLRTQLALQWVSLARGAAHAHPAARCSMSSV